MQPALESTPKNSRETATSGSGIVRIFYTVEFLAALTAIFVSWGQIGGQSHLDIMPWYWKFGLGMGLALSVVKVTQAASSKEQVWNRETLIWSALIVIVLIGMGLVTYYYHVHENDEELLEDDVRIEKTLSAPSIMDASQFLQSA